jgi:hypothetical protein
MQDTQTTNNETGNKAERGKQGFFLVPTGGVEPPT